MRNVARLVFVGILLVSGVRVSGGVSWAQEPGGTLAAAVTAAAVGEAAAVTLDDVSAFAPAGGAAVFEPGSPDQEAFSYASADPATNQLIGLTRVAPAEHDAGAFVATTGIAAPVEPLAPVATAPPGADGAEPPPPGEVVTDCSDGSCGDTGLDEMIAATCDAGACDAIDDPIGAWSACDLDRGDEVDETCPDAHDLVDTVWDSDAGPADLHCTASVSGPDISSGGGMTTGRGTFDCGEYVTFVEITVCLHRNAGGGWVEMGCRYKKKMIGEGGVWGSVSKKIAEPCLRQDEVAYRIRARGWAVDGGGEDQVDEDRDSATAKAELYCPGTSLDGAVDDGVEYGESWLPSDE
ncbi:MAG TPA: hypothetical protein VG318_17325 [Actinomycetota bacterium]|nr:hypothetical protein [Actinomycetota bacterium]